MSQIKKIINPTSSDQVRTEIQSIYEEIKLTQREATPEPETQVQNNASKFISELKLILSQ